jgi:hypothetical protein
MQGPEPDGVRELLDAAQGVPNMTPEQRARMRARLRAGIAEDDRAWKRRRVVKRVVVVTTATLALAAGVLLVVRFAMAPDPTAGKPTPTDHRRAREIPTKSNP